MHLQQFYLDNLLMVLVVNNVFASSNVSSLLMFCVNHELQCLYLVTIDTKGLWYKTVAVTFMMDMTTLWESNNSNAKEISGFSYFN